jgi:hypothetical protein
MRGNDTGSWVREVRRGARQFALLYFHFCKTLVESLGEKEALPLVQKAVFELALDRTDRTRREAQRQGFPPDLAHFSQVNDLPRSGWEGWTPEMGGLRCPYAEAWVAYFKEYPWFKPFASLYCDVIDTTAIENFTRTTSHRITKNLLWGDGACEREYFESPQVKGGALSYGKRREGEFYETGDLP